MPAPEYVPDEEPADDFPTQEPSGDGWEDGYRELTARIDAALVLHEPTRLCVAHHQQHECTEPHGYAYRCYTCARTNRLACRTWRTLTGKDKPDA